jgi:type I restriction enzyme M protein
MAKSKNNKQEENEPLEKQLWKAADKLRKNMDAAEYKHIVLGLIFLKYISDAFEELYQKLVAQQKSEGADPEDKNEYTAEKVFYVPPSARWKWLQGRAKLPTIGKDVDDAMEAIEKVNRIKLLMDKTIDKVKKEAPKIYSKELIELLFHQPYTRIGFLVEAGIAARKAAALYLRELEKIKLLWTH